MVPSANETIHMGISTVSSSNNVVAPALKGSLSKGGKLMPGHSSRMTLAFNCKREGTSQVKVTLRVRPLETDYDDLRPIEIDRDITFQLTKRCGSGKSTSILTGPVLPAFTSGAVLALLLFMVYHRRRLRQARGYARVREMHPSQP